VQIIVDVHNHKSHIDVRLQHCSTMTYQYTDTVRILFVFKYNAL